MHLEPLFPSAKHIFAFFGALVRFLLNVTRRLCAENYDPENPQNSTEFYGVPNPKIMTHRILQNSTEFWVERSRKLSHNSEIYAITEYLFKNGEKKKNNSSDFSGNPVKGQELFKAVGCMGCHSINNEKSDLMAENISYELLKANF